MGQKKLICIDDKSDILTLLELIFKDDYNVKLFEKEEEAISYANEFHPDLAIIDMNLDNMKGTEVLEELRKIKSDIKSLILTGYDDESYIENIRIYKPNEIVKKPFDIIKLRDVVKEIINQ